MKNKDTQLLEEAYGKVGQNEIARRQQEADERLPHITKALEDNKDLSISNLREFYKWQEKNLPGLWNYANSDLHAELGPELEKAYKAGYSQGFGEEQKDYVNPFPERTLWWWMIELSRNQGASDV